MEILNRNLLGLNIKAVEEKYSAKYVGDFCRKIDGEWENRPAAVFYQENPPKIAKSNYFALILVTEYGIDLEPIGETMYISDGASAVSEVVAGIVAKNGDVIYSVYRRDHPTSPDESVSIGGGRDYVLTNNSDSDRLVHITVKDGELIIEPLKKSA